MEKIKGQFEFRNSIYIWKSNVDRMNLYTRENNLIIKIFKLTRKPI